MLGLAWPEILLIGAVAIVAIGPKDIPPLMRKLGAWSRQARAMYFEFKKHWDDLPQQVSVLEMQKEADALQKKTFEKFNVDLSADREEDEAHIAAVKPAGVEAMSADDGVVSMPKDKKP